LLFDEKLNHKRKATDNGTANFAPDFREPFRIIRDSLKIFLNSGTEFKTQTFTLGFIPRNGIIKLPLRNASKNEAAFHLRYFASSLALTSASETTSSGWSRCS